MNISSQRSRDGGGIVAKFKKKSEGTENRVRKPVGQLIIIEDSRTFFELNLVRQQLNDTKVELSKTTQMMRQSHKTIELLHAIWIRRKLLMRHCGVSLSSCRVIRIKAKSADGGNIDGVQMLIHMRMKLRTLLKKEQRMNGFPYCWLSTSKCRRLRETQQQELYHPGADV